jgi:hypothetical protein
MVMRAARFATLLLLTGGTVTAIAAGPDLKEGEWGVSYRMEVVGMPFPMPPITVRKTMCLSQKDYIPDNSQQGQDCKISDQKVTGNTVTWTMRCKTREGAIEGHGRVTYHGDRYDGVMEAQLTGTDNSDMPARYRYTMKGERLGVCTR